MDKDTFKNRMVKVHKAVEALDTGGLSCIHLSDYVAYRARHEYSELFCPEKDSPGGFWMNDVDTNLRKGHRASALCLFELFAIDEKLYLRYEGSL